MSCPSTGRRLPTPSRAERAVASASKGHCLGYAVLGRGDGIRMQAESLLELHHPLLLNADPTVMALQEQVRFRYGSNGERQHVFDVVATATDGTRTAYAIKPERRLVSGRFLDEMETVAWWVRAKDFADEVRILSEADVDPVALHNAKVVAAVREPDPEADAAAATAVRGLTGGVALRDLTALTGLGARGYRALLRLVRDGGLRLLRPERLAPTALVLPTGAL